MAAAVKRKNRIRRNQKPHPRKGRTSQTKRKKRQVKQGRRRTRSRQVRRHTTKKQVPKGADRQRRRRFTKGGKGVMSSCGEGLCQAVSSGTECLRKEKDESTGSGPALPQLLVKEEARQSLTPGTKKSRGKKQNSRQ